MPHGDLSDLTALAMWACGVQHIFYPSFHLGDVLPQLELKKEFETLTPELELLMKFTGGLLLILGCMLFTVRWNTINGKLSGFAMISLAGYLSWICYNTLDKGVVVPRQWYILSGFLGLGGFSLMFLANPVIKEKKD